MVNQWFGGIYKEPKNMFARFASEPDRLFHDLPELKLSPEEQRAFIADRTGCIIGKETAAKYNIKVGDRMTLQGRHFPRQARLHGPRHLRLPARQRDDVLQRSVPI